MPGWFRFCENLSQTLDLTTLASQKISGNLDQPGITEILMKSGPLWHQGNFHKIKSTSASQKFSRNLVRTTLASGKFSRNLNQPGIREIFTKSGSPQHYGNFHEIRIDPASRTFSENPYHLDITEIFQEISTTLASRKYS